MGLISRMLSGRMVAALTLLALALGLLAAIPAAEAQAPSCWEKVYEYRETDFGFGTVIVRPIRSWLEFNDSCLSVNDDRVNANDHAAAAAIYCRPDGVAVWDIDDLSRGELAFLVTYEVIDAVPENLESNLLLVDHGGFRLYALTSGELQLNSPPDWEGKEYVFTWPGCEH